MKNRIIVYILLLGLLVICGNSMADGKVYVGSESCKDCHEQEYTNYLDYSKKAKS